MGAYISEDKIKEINNNADIIEIISERVVLKKAGKNYLGLCPFHAEKTPSFSVSPDKQIYYCFGCGAGGNVISFLMRQDGLSFPEAVKQLANRYGIDIPQGKLTPEQRRQITQREQLLAVNNSAMQFYRRMLLDEREGQKARDYLTGRGMTQQTIHDFQMGYAPNGWDHLLRHFAKERVPTKVLEMSGLAIPRKGKSGHYDRFRDRLIFPILNLDSQVIGFGGRVFDDTVPKYLNSPETPVYHKSRSLYGLNRAKSKCRQTGCVYIVEGYFDLVSLHMRGIENAVATLGTSLTPQHLQVLKGFVGKSGKAILVYDSDAAGIKAALRSVSVFNEGFMTARIMVLPQGHDPDSYLSSHGPEAFIESSAQAMDIIPFLLENAIKKYGLSVDGKLKIIDALKVPLKEIDDSLARSLYIKTVSERLQIEETAILQRVREALPEAGRKPWNNAGGTSESPGRTVAPKKRREPSFEGRNYRFERQIVAMMLNCPDIIADVCKLNLIDYFENSHLKTIGVKIVDNERRRDSGRVDILDLFEEQSIKDLIASLMMEDNQWELNGCRRLIAQYQLNIKKHQRKLLQKIKIAEEKNDLELLQKLLMETQCQARNDIKNPESAGG